MADKTTGSSGTTKRPIDYINEAITDACRVLAVEPTSEQRDLMKLPLMILWEKAKNHG